MGAMDAEFLSKLRKEFLESPKNCLARNFCFKASPLEASVERSIVETLHHVFSHKVEAEGKPMTHQKSSGRCWIFAMMNSMRIPFMKQFNLDDFEFSQAHLFFWDKIERSNYFLHKMVEAYKSGEKPEGRLVSFLLMTPVQDGGQWDMLVNLVNKYGLMPKKAFPESFCCENSGQLNGVLYSKLREFARDLFVVLEKGGSDADVEAKIREQMKVIYQIVGICLGIPPEKFDWEFIDKSKTYRKISNLTSVEFYQTHVKPLYNVDDKVCLVNDPRESSGFGRPLKVEYLGNMVEGRETLYNNQNVEVLMRAVADSVRANEVVWFGCDVGKYFHRKPGMLSTEVRNYALLFDTTICKEMSKAERLRFGDGQMSHAMVITGVSYAGVSSNPTKPAAASASSGDAGKEEPAPAEDPAPKAAADEDLGLPVKYRVENSWGEDSGEKGYLVMTDGWFRDHVFEVVVDRKFLSSEVLDAMKKDPVVLPPWDPMGALA